MTRDEEILVQVMAKRGYFTIGSPVALAIGSEPLGMFLGDRPADTAAKFYIVAETTAEEALELGYEVARELGVQVDPGSMSPQYRYFYRVSTD